MEGSVRLTINGSQVDEQDNRTWIVEIGSWSCTAKCVLKLQRSTSRWRRSEVEIIV